LSNAAHMARLPLPLLAFLCAAGVAVAEERPQGLLWNRSGLAATLPLQVKTDRGRDYVLHLRAINTGQAVLAAYIRGGEFFRVLAPPGSFEVVFFSGEVWRGEDELFAPETHHLILDRALTFGASVSRKNGHLIDLRKDAETVVKDFAICQRLALDPDSLIKPREPIGDLRSARDQRPSGDRKVIQRRYVLRSRVCD